jgi:hypothetical protein
LTARRTLEIPCTVCSRETSGNIHRAGKLYPATAGGEDDRTPTGPTTASPTANQTIAVHASVAPQTGEIQICVDADSTGGQQTQRVIPRSANHDPGIQADGLKIVKHRCVLRIRTENSAAEPRAVIDLVCSARGVERNFMGRDQVAEDTRRSERG